MNANKTDLDRITKMTIYWKVIDFEEFFTAYIMVKVGTVHFRIYVSGKDFSVGKIFICTKRISASILSMYIPPKKEKCFTKNSSATKPR